LKVHNYLNAGFISPLHNLQPGGPGFSSLGPTSLIWSVFSVEVPSFARGFWSLGLNLTSQLHDGIRYFPVYIILLR